MSVEHDVRVRILVIEDEHKLAGVLKRGLEEHGYAVDVAYDGEDGLGLATAAPYAPACAGSGRAAGCID